MKPTYSMFDGNHNIVGFAFTLDGNPALLTGVHVLPQYRGHGHGRALVGQVCRDADREHKDLMLSLDHDPEIDFIRYMNFFKDFGFTALEDGITMRRSWVNLNGENIPRSVQEHRFYRG